MWRFIGSRVLQSIPVLLVVITATFFLVRAAPGGPFASVHDHATTKDHSSNARVVIALSWFADTACLTTLNRE